MTHAQRNPRYAAAIIALILLYTTSCIEDKVEPLLLGSIRGTVVSTETGDPLAEVKIITAPVTNVVFTDEDGAFQIQNVPEGEYTVITDLADYARESMKIRVNRSASTNINIKLVSSTILAPAPTNPVPTDRDSDQPLSLTLRWMIDESPGVTFNVRVFEGNQLDPFILVENLADTLLELPNLKYNTTYFWQVDAMSSSGYTTSGNMWRFKTIPFPANRITFTSNRSGNYEIYSTDLAGDSLVRITHSSYHELKPLFTHDRAMIAFAANSGVDYHIYTVNNDGTALRKVTTLPIAGYHNQGIGFAWSPDNGKFIYSYNTKLYRIDRDGTNLTQIATAPAERNFRSSDWTSVGNKIVVETVGASVFDSEIYLMNADGSDMVKVVDNLPGIISSPTFSIDGKLILFTRDASGYESEDGRQLDSRIFVLDIESGQITDLSGNKTDGTNDLQPRFSPDGSTIIFVNASNDGTGKKSIWIMDKDGGNRQLLFDDAEMPNWK
jgi:TolB protein